MADRSFTANVTTIIAAWLNVINNFVYRGKRPTYGTTTGAANVFSLALEADSLVTTAGLADGDSFLFRAHQANSGAATFALTVGATTIGSAAIQIAGAALAGSEILSGGIYQVTRVGAVWQLNGQALSLTLPVSIANGGTGQITAGAALIALGGAASGANTDITSLYLNNTGLKIKDTNGSHGLSIVPGSDLTADRILTIITGDAARSLTLTGDLAMSGAFNLTHTLTGNTNVTYPTTGTLSTLAGAEELDNKTLDASVAKGVWTASGTWTVPAFTLAGTVTGTGQTISNFIALVGTGATVTNMTSDARLHVVTGTDGGFCGAFGQTHATNPSATYWNHTATNNDAGHAFIRCDEGGGSALVRFQFYSNGGLANYSANNVNLSDIKFKTAVSILTSVWDDFKRLEIVQYKYKDQTHDDFNYGVIAQQVETVFPTLVESSIDDMHPEDGVVKRVYENDIKWIGMSVLQEALLRIEKLEEEVRKLRA